MRRPRCARAWAAEAARDGRVSGDEHGAFLAHAAQCSDCTAELRRLEHLGDALRAMRITRPDDLATRRQRQQLLATLDAAATRPTSRASRWSIMGAAAVVLIGLAIMIGLWWRKNAVAPVGPQAFVVHVQPAGARWSTHREEMSEVIVLEEGHLEIQSVGKDAQHRLIVRVPDGEIEDVGTRFVVLVRSGQTERIDVSEGLVVFRSVDKPDRLVYAGERWSVELPAAAVSVASLPGAATAAVAVPPLDVRSAATGVGLAETPRRREKRAIHQAPAIDDYPTAAAGEAFGAAMATFHRGEFANAAAAFETFIMTFPSDPRAEDASFLRAVASARLGDVKSAARLAQEYLARYPHGLRRIEAERLAAPRATESSAPAP